MKKLIIVLLICALVLVGWSVKRLFVDVKPEGFTFLQVVKTGDETITTYSGSGSVESATEIFNKWAVGQNWVKSYSELDREGYYSTVYKKRKDAMLINVIMTDSNVNVTVIVIAGGASDFGDIPVSTSTPTIVSTKPLNYFIKFDTLFDLSDQYKEIECETPQYILTFKFYGRDVINHVEVEHVQMLIRGDIFDFWLDETGKTVLKMVQNGEELDIGGSMSDTGLLEPLSFFFSGEVWDVSFLENPEKFDVIQDLGFGSVVVTRYISYWDKDDTTLGGRTDEVFESDDGLIRISGGVFVDSVADTQIIFRLLRLIKR